MRIGGKIRKSKTDQFWLAEIPILDLMVQAESKEEIPETLKDAIELLVDDPSFSVDATLAGTMVFIESKNAKKLTSLILKRQRRKSGLKLEEVASYLNTSLNDYAQYEQGKHMPGIDKLEHILNIINPSLMFYFSGKS